MLLLDPVELCDNFFILLMLLILQWSDRPCAYELSIHFTDQLEDVDPLVSVDPCRGIQLHSPVTELKLEIEIPGTELIFVLSEA